MAATDKLCTFDFTKAWLGFQGRGHQQWLPTCFVEDFARLPALSLPARGYLPAIGHHCQGTPRL